MRCLIIFLSSLTLAMPAISSSHYFQMYAGTDVSTRLAGESGIASQVNRLGAKLELNGNSLRASISGEYQYDSVYGFEDRYSADAEDEYQSRIWLEEAFLSWSNDRWTASAGFQKVVWGQADDLRVLDIVNPLDLKDFVLPDIDEYRKPVPMVKVTHYLRNWNIEAFWISEVKSHTLPPSGSEFDFGIPQADVAEDEPDGGEFGLSALTNIAGWDVGLYAFDGYHDNPVFRFQETQLVKGYSKEEMLGFSLSKPVGDWVARSEFVHFNNRSHSRSDGSLSRSPVYQGLLGLDYLYKDWMFTFQYTDSFIQDWESSFLSSRSEKFITLAADTTLLAGRANLRFAGTASRDTGEGQLYQIKFGFWPTEKWKIQLNLDILDGDSNNFLGQFSSNDRVYFSVKRFL